MVRQDLIGKWNLVASGSMNSEVAFINDEEPDPNGVSDWLNDVDDGLLDAAKPTFGLTLTIAADGAFSEYVSGKPEIYWFDEEGVLQAEVSPFNGIVISKSRTSYLRPVNIEKWAIPVEGRYGDSVLRYDDGDTKISDGIRIAEDRLIRTVNIVTDELYLNRVVIVYKRGD